MMNLCEKRTVIRWLARYRRLISRRFGRRLHELPSGVPLISFTFDDFPRSALYTAGDILASHELRATFYASLGLAGSAAPTGEVFQLPDLSRLVNFGHELGCHTFHHCPAASTPSFDYERSVLRNREALKEILPESDFATHSYPVGSARPATKRRCARHFAACRAGGQKFNLGTVDLNALSAFFIEQAQSNTDLIHRVIDDNANAGGWLIFATHDVSETPTRFGCAPRIFREVVHASLRSGAHIVPVHEALQLRAVNYATS